MRNIVYNSKLKKLITKTILVMLLFNFIAPYVVLAYNFKYEEGKDLYNAFNYQYENPMRVVEYLSERNSDEVVKTILNQDNRNKIEFSKDEQGNVTWVNIYATDISIIETAFTNTNLSESAVTSICNGEYPYNEFIRIVQAENPTIPNDSEEDNRTDEQKIRDYLRKKWPKLQETQIDVLIQKWQDPKDEDVQVTWDENKNVIDVQIENTFLATWGIGDIADEIITDDEDDDNWESITEEGENDWESITGEESSAEATGILDKYTGIILEPTVEFFTFVFDSIMSVFSAIMKDESIEWVMVSKEDIGKLPNQGEIGATFTIPNMKPYASASGKLDNLKFPRFSYSPEELFLGEIDLVNANFINKSNDDENWLNIRNVVSQWYQILRMIAIIGLLSVLIYIGIKIIISSNSKDKAKYKEMIVNWLVAAILAFTMHYIMGFILSVIDEITNLLSGLTRGIQVNAGGTTFVTNLIGLARFQIQQHHFSAKVGHLIIYIALVVYTIKFTILYFKRMLTMAFLTIISPIVALTYPIDKANDGKAQGFQMWLKEFLFNALLQPMHYILYYILVSSALTLAANNPLYGVIVIGFMSHAEKIFKKIFGFEKARAGTVGGIAGAFATGAITSSLINTLKAPMSGSNGKNATGVTNNQDYNDDFDLEYINFNEDILDENDLLRTNLRGHRTIPGVDDSIYRYRQTLPQSVEELGGLYFDDGNHNSLETLLRKIANKQFKLLDNNISPEERTRIENQLLGLNAVLENRVLQNEMPFNGNLQYTDEYKNRSTMDLINEIKSINNDLKNPNLTPEEKNQKLIRVSKLLKTVKRRMAQNQYMQRNNVIPSLTQHALNSGTEQQGILQQGAPQQGAPQQGAPQQGAPQQGAPQQGEQQQGAQQQGAQQQGEQQDAQQQGEQQQGAQQQGAQQQGPQQQQGAQQQGAQQQGAQQQGPQQQGPQQQQGTQQQGPQQQQGAQQQGAQQQGAQQQGAQQQGAQQQGAQQQGPQQQRTQQQRAQQRTNAWKEFKKNHPTARGLANVGRSLAKPVWDTQKDARYNGERLIKNIVKGAVGATVGVAAATVQAGISITDGKYKPIEGVGTFAAGMTATTMAINGIGNRRELKPEDRRSLEKYTRQWYNNDAVINAYSAEYGGDEKDRRNRAAQNYVSRGITDAKEQIQAMKFADQIKRERGIDEKEADHIAAATLQYRKDLIRTNHYKAVYNKKDKDKYVRGRADTYAGSASRDSIIRLHEDLIENVRDFDKANL